MRTDRTSIFTSKYSHRSFSIITCLAVSTVLTTLSCASLHVPPTNKHDGRSAQNPTRKRNKLRKPKNFFIESDISDFGNPLIPDLSENEQEEKIINALSQGNARQSRRRNQFQEKKVTTCSTSTRKKRKKSGTLKRGSNRHQKRIKKRSRTYQPNVKRKRRDQKDSPEIGEATNLSSEEKLLANRGIHCTEEIPQVPIKGESPKAPQTETLLVKDHPSTPTSNKNEDSISARQTLTTSVDESLSRLKRMNALKQEAPQKSREREGILGVPTVTTCKPLSQSSLDQNRPKPNHVPSTRARMQDLAKKGTRPFLTNKTKQVKHMKEERSLPTTMSLTTPWARRFILSRPKDALLPIPREFLSDGFNLVQLAPVVERAVETMKLRGEGNLSKKLNTNSDASRINTSLYKVALRLILKEENRHLNNNSTVSYPYTPFQIQKAAEVLYIMVHARYVSSPRGLDTIRRMFKRNNEVGIEPIFGRCSRIDCNGMPLLPIGLSDNYDVGGKGGAGRRAMRYCPSCNETFYMWESKVDGAAWGTSFAHLLLMAQGSELFSFIKKQGEERIRQPVRKIFGFRIHPKADVNKFKKKL